MRTYLTALALVCALASVAIADGKHHRFVGIHPVPKGHGGGLCHIEAHHVHLYAPVDVKVQYRVHDGWHHFVGDPVAYGWEGPKHSYYGHHPIEIHAVVGDDHEDTAYCYLEGPHYHAWAPPPDRRRPAKLVSGAATTGAAIRGSLPTTWHCRQLALASWLIGGACLPAIAMPRSWHTRQVGTAS